jgi:hypothetical protein
MMRLRPRATLLVAFFVLASAATAYAECAFRVIKEPVDALTVVP